MKVKLWNDNVHDFKQKYRDDLIFIPAKSFIEMEEDDAHNFVCQYSPPVVDASGTQKPESYKMLKIERDGSENKLKLDPFTCQACNYKAVNKKDLTTHVEARIGDGKHMKVENDSATNMSADEMIDSLSPEALEKLTSILAAKLAPKRGRPAKED